MLHLHFHWCDMLMTLLTFPTAAHPDAAAAAAANVDVALLLILVSCLICKFFGFCFPFLL